MCEDTGRGEFYAEEFTYNVYVIAAYDYASNAISTKGGANRGDAASLSYIALTAGATWKSRCRCGEGH